MIFMMMNDAGQQFAALCLCREIRLLLDLYAEMRLTQGQLLPRLTSDAVVVGTVNGSIKGGGTYENVR